LDDRVNNTQIEEIIVTTLKLYNLEVIFSLKKKVFLDFATPSKKSIETFFIFIFLLLDCVIQNSFFMKNT